MWFAPPSSQARVGAIPRARENDSRNETVASSGLFFCDEVCLWFEHDLYDQLQLLQLLDWFHGRWPGNVQRNAPAASGSRLSLVSIGDHESVSSFLGLGQLEPEYFPALFDDRITVGRDLLKLGQEGWRAFRADPLCWLDLATHPRPALPFLANAMTRLLQEPPSTRNGLGRTEQQALNK